MKIIDFIKKDNHYVFIIYIFLGTFFLRKLLYTTERIGFNHDWIFPYSAYEFKLYNAQAFYIWSDYNLGYQLLYPAQYLLQYILSVLSYLGVNGNTALKPILLFILIFSGYFMYLLSRKSFGLDYIPSFFSGIFYMTSPVMFNKIVAGHLLYLIGYTLSPLILVYFIRFLKNNEKKDLIITGLLIAITAIQVQFSIMLIALLFLFNIFFNKMKINRIFKIILFLIGIISLIHIFWIIPSLINLFELVEHVTFASDVGSLNSWSTSIVNAFRLIGYRSSHFETALYNSDYQLTWNISSFILLSLIFSSLLINKCRVPLFFGIISLVALIFTTALSDPFGDLVYFLYSNITVFGIFREVYHLTFLISFSYSIMLAYAIDNILKLKKLKSSETIYVIFVFFIIYLNNPFIYTGNFDGQLQTYNMSDSDLLFINDYQNTDIDYRVLYLPMVQPIKYNNLTYYGIDSMISFSKKSTLGNQLSNVFSREFAYMLYNPDKNINIMLDISSIKYIFFRNQYQSMVVRYLDQGKYKIGNKWHDIRSIWTNDNLNKTLMNQHDLKPIKMNENIFVLENENYLPHISTATTPILFEGEMEDMFDAISYDDNFTMEGNSLFLSNQMNIDKLKFLKNSKQLIYINNYIINLTVYDGSEYPFNWNNLSDHLIEARKYIGWKSVIRADGQESEDTLSTPKAIPSKFPFNSSTGWTAHDSTLIYLKTNKKIAVTNIKECKEKKVYSANIVGNINKNNIEVLSERRINVSELKENEAIGVYLPGRKPIISINSNESYGFYFPDTTDIPYSTLSWSSLNSTILYYKTENNPVAITGIKDETGNISKDIVGVWWKKGWLGMNSEKVEYPIVLPPYETIIIQINHKTDELEMSYQYISPEDLIISTKSICNDIDDIIGIWWETDWMDMGTKPIKLPANIPANQRAIIQINHIIKDKVNFATIDLIDSEKFVESKISLPKLIFKKANPTRYNVHIENAIEPFFLVFSESFHTQWKAYPDDDGANKEFKDIIAEYERFKVKEARHETSFAPKDVFFLLKEPLAEDLHFTANGYANSWYIDPSEIDKDGDGNFTLTLYFKPQSYFYIGLAISLTTFILCVLYLIYDWRKNRNRRKEETEDALGKNQEKTR